MYTYDNLLNNPTKEGIESLIGKEVYFHESPSFCLWHANRKSTSNSGILVKIDKDSLDPFIIRKDDLAYSASCIIEKKEEPKPEYRPFNDSCEFINSYFGLDTDNKEHLLQLLGVSAIWLKSKTCDFMCQVTEIWNDGVILGNNQKTTSWEELLEDYVFLDEKPCGRLMENEDTCSDIKYQW